MTNPSPTSPASGPLEPAMRCPQCSGGDLRVLAELVCRVVAKAYANPQTDGSTHYDAIEPIDGAEPYWDRDSFTQCLSCGHDGDVKDFEPEGAHG